eukprot:637299-Lingulodinium_polyedra.AAC.1
MVWFRFRLGRNAKLNQIVARRNGLQSNANRDNAQRVVLDNAPMLWHTGRITRVDTMRGAL